MGGEKQYRAKKDRRKRKGGHEEEASEIRKGKRQTQERDERGGG